MIFNTVWFWLFFPAALLALTITPAQVRPWMALAACVVFHYHFAGPAGMAPVLVLGFAVYLAARQKPARKSTLLAAAILACILALLYYKYTTYFAGLFSVQGDWTKTAVPLGISFFTFEYVHYLTEVRKGSRPMAGFRDFWLFTLFFPSLVAGPIKRYQDYGAQLKEEHAFRPTFQSIVEGGTRILVGAAKKTLLADPLAALSDNLHDQIMSAGTTSVTARSWLLLVALSLRIYFDFSGYSDMALGAARALNIRLPENFNWPYLTRSLTDFWRRWHISLSSWIRDYVYIPLGGGRVSAGRRLFNFLFAFAICGLWHGAETHYVVWGLWHGAGLGAERAMGRGFGSVVTLVFVGVGWLIFFYPLDQAWRIGLHLLSL